MKKIAWPAPGCHEAVAKGCTCPPEDNKFGKGFEVGLSAHYWCREDCPIHGSLVVAKIKERKNG